MHPRYEAFQQLPIVPASGKSETVDISYVQRFWPTVEYVMQLDWAAAAAGRKPGSERVDDYYAPMERRYGILRDKALVLSLRVIFFLAPDSARRALVEAFESALTPQQVEAIFPGAYSSPGGRDQGRGDIPNLGFDPDRGVGWDSRTATLG